MASSLSSNSVSVVIPAYKCADAIGRAVSKALDQSHPPLEIIVVDDQSPDDIASALAPFHADERVRLIRHAHNQGAAAARNTGIDAARGRFVAFLDADDEWLPEKLAAQMADVMAQGDPDRCFSVTRTYIHRQGHDIVRPLRPKRPDERMDEFIFVHAGFCQTSSFLVSRALAAQVRWRAIPVNQDHLFAIDLCNVGALYRLVETPLVIYNDDIRPNRISDSRSLAIGETLLDTLGDALSDKAKLAYRARFLGQMLLREQPARGVATIAKAVATGAMPPRFAMTLLIRQFLPPSLYHGIRGRLLGRAESR